MNHVLIQICTIYWMQMKNSSHGSPGKFFFRTNSYVLNGNAMEKYIICHNYFKSKFISIKFCKISFQNSFKNIFVIKQNFMLQASRVIYLSNGIDVWWITLLQDVVNFERNLFVAASGTHLLKSNSFARSVTF